MGRGIDLTYGAWVRHSGVLNLVGVHDNKGIGTMFATVWKAILAFVALVVTNLLAQVTTTGFVFPNSTAGWVSFVGTTVIGTLLVYAKANKPVAGKAGTVTTPSA